MQSCGRSACCQEKFVWMLKNVQEGLACKWVLLSHLKCLQRSPKVFIFSKLYGLFTQASTLWPQEGLLPPPGCERTTLLLNLQADMLPRLQVFFPVMWQEGYISEKIISNTALCLELLCKVLWNTRMPSFYWAWQRAVWKPPIKVVNPGTGHGSLSGVENS